MKSEELYEQILNEDFDYSTLDKLIALERQEAREIAIKEFETWLKQRAETYGNIVDVVRSFDWDYKK